MIQSKQIQRPQLVLVVDDQEINRDALEITLEDRYNVICATNGKEALDLMHKHSEELSIVLLDLMMPVMNGFELVTELRRNPDWRPIPIVVVTAKELTREDREHLDGHVERIFRKGAIERDDFLREVRDLLDSVAAVEHGRGGRDG